MNNFSEKILNINTHTKKTKPFIMERGSLPSCYYPFPFFLSGGVQNAR